MDEDGVVYIAMLQNKPKPYTFKTKMPRLHNRDYLIQIRKHLRNNSTAAESTLWKILKKRQVGGYKFRRQHSIGKYVVDFYCPELQLVLEYEAEHLTFIGIQNIAPELQVEIEVTDVQDQAKCTVCHPTYEPPQGDAAYY